MLVSKKGRVEGDDAIERKKKTVVHQEKTDDMRDSRNSQQDESNFNQAYRVHSTKIGY